MKTFSKTLALLATISVYFLTWFTLQLPRQSHFPFNYSNKNFDGNGFIPNINSSEHVSTSPPNGKERGASNTVTNESGGCEKVGTEIREYLKKEMPDANLTKTEEGGPLRILIVATMRTGSTFLGQILASHPETFYLFEPLSKYGFSQVRQGLTAMCALSDLKNLFQCRFHEFNKTCHQLIPSNKYPSVIWPAQKPWLGKVWQGQSSCLNEDFLTTACREFPVQAFKIVRLRLRAAQKLLEDQRLNLKILYLVRDPRAVMSSRIKMGWCLKNGGAMNCSQTPELCQDLVTEFYLSKVLRQRYPHRFMTIKYEAMTNNVYNATESVLQFLGLGFHANVKQFLDDHTKSRSRFGSHSSFFSTFRDTGTMALKWIKDLEGNFSVIESIQNTCAEALRLWRYKFVTSHDVTEYNKP